MSDPNEITTGRTAPDVARMMEMEMAEELRAVQGEDGRVEFEVVQGLRLRPCACGELGCIRIQEVFSHEWYVCCGWCGRMTIEDFNNSKSSAVEGWNRAATILPSRGGAK